MAAKRGKSKVKAGKSASRKKRPGKKPDVSYGQKAQKTEDITLSDELSSLERIGLQKPFKMDERYEKTKPAKQFFHFESDAKAPSWFYIGSIFAAYLFTAYISIYASIHFESIEYMNMTIVFLFISLVSFFLVSGVYLFFEKKSLHSLAPILFFVGITSIMVYAFKAIDTSGLVRYSIMFAIIVAAISVYSLAARK